MLFRSDGICPKYQIGFVHCIPEYNKNAVRWLSFDAWVQLEEHQYFGFMSSLLNGAPPLAGIILETLDQAEEFVNLMEQHFTLHALKRSYA